MVKDFHNWLEERKISEGIARANAMINQFRRGNAPKSLDEPGLARQVVKAVQLPEPQAIQPRQRQLAEPIQPPKPQTAEDLWTQKSNDPFEVLYAWCHYGQGWKSDRIVREKSQSNGMFRKLMGLIGALNQVPERAKELFFFIADKNRDRVLSWANEITTPEAVMSKLRDWQTRGILTHEIPQ